MDYQRAPYVSWDTLYTPKTKGGLSVKNLNMWNMACIVKLVWAIAKKKDSLWFQWIHERYLRGKEIWDYTPKGDTSWYWKKMQKVKDRFETFPEGDYRVKASYIWLIQQDNKPPGKR